MIRYARLAFTEDVRSVQRERGSAEAMDRLLGADTGELDRIGPAEAEFIGERDGLYLASISADGWPYVQYRGGPPGFVHVLDSGTLAYLEVLGNRQFITTGNLRGEERVALFFMDYAHRTRLKVLARAQTLDPAQDPELTGRLSDVRTDGRPEQLMVIRVEGVAWNCSKHITPRFSEAELAEALTPVRRQLADLVAENQALRAKLAES